MDHSKPFQWQCAACGLLQDARDGRCAACGAEHPDLAASAPPMPSLLGRDVTWEPLSPPQLRALCFEVGVVLLLTWGYAWYGGLAEVFWPEEVKPASSFWYKLSNHALMSAQNIALVMFVVWRNREPWSVLGLERFRPVKDPLAAVRAYFSSPSWLRPAARPRCGVARTRRILRIRRRPRSLHRGRSLGLGPTDGLLK